MNEDGITIIERYERGGLVAYSVDEGDSYHPTVHQALEHQAKVNGLAKKDPEATDE